MIATMQPLSPRKRRTYLFVLIALFFVIVPVVILYASGYRFKGEFGFVQTGGIFISVPRSEITVLMNGEVVGQSGVLRKTFYISDLPPGSYVMQAMREGYYPWHRTLIVQPRLVTDANVFLVSEDPELFELTVATTTSTTTRRIARELYNSYITAFNMAPPTTTPQTAQGALFVEQGDLYLRWLEAEQTPPSTFCLAPASCVQEIPIESGRPRTATAAFWRGGIVYTTLEGGVYVAEGDIRPTAVVAPLYPVRGATFRIIDGHLIIKDGNKLYEIDGL